MKTCKDCLHYEACNGWVNEKALEQYVSDNDCEDFTDRSEWVHLPCKVGDEIFNAEDMQEFPNTYDDDHILAFVVNDEGFGFETDNYHCRPISEIGKTVFFAREEAEKALERMKENEKRNDKH